MPRASLFQRFGLDGLAGLPLRTFAGLRAAAEVALPPICAACDADIDGAGDTIPLCAACGRTFSTPAGSICCRCGAPGPAVSIRPDGCSHCRTTKFHFDQIAALGVYRGHLQTLVLRMKHLSGESLALAAGRLLAKHIADLHWEPRVDWVTAPPTHWLRRFSQHLHLADVLAEAVARELGLPLALNLLKSTRIVARQSSLTPARRRHNLRKAFRASTQYDLRDAHVLVIDDVLTTGATANAVSLALRRAGAKSISIGVVARGIGAT